MPDTGPYTPLGMHLLNKSYDGRADEIISELPDGEYTIAGFRGQESTVVIKRVPVVTMTVGDHVKDIATMMPKVRMQIAERCKEAGPK